MTDAETQAAEQYAENNVEREEREATYMERTDGDASWAVVGSRTFGSFYINGKFYAWRSEDKYSLAPEWSIIPSYIES